jgi:hypothetical protein
MRIEYEASENKKEVSFLQFHFQVVDQLFPNNPKNQKQSRKALFLWYGEGSGNHHSNKGRRMAIDK